VINTPTKGKMPERGGFKVRRAAAEYRVPCLTSLDTALALLKTLRELRAGQGTACEAIQEYLARTADQGAV